MEYEKLEYSLTCEKNDNIDNASYDIICAIADEREESEKMEAVIRLCQSLMPDDVVFDKDIINMKNLLSSIAFRVSDFEIVRSGTEVDWNMEQISEITDIVKSELENNNILVCHPFFVEDDSNGNDSEDSELLCCLSTDRCTGCPYWE